jgi:hypothetical protein
LSHDGNGPARPLDVGVWSDGTSDQGHTDSERTQNSERKKWSRLLACHGEISLHQSRNNRSCGFNPQSIDGPAQLVGIMLSFSGGATDLGELRIDRGLFSQVTCVFIIGRVYSYMRPM